MAKIKNGNIDGDGLVQLLDSGHFQMSLNAEVIEEIVCYIVENDGHVEDFEDYNEALEYYILELTKKQAKLS
jgi:hypothetical protein